MRFKKKSIWVDSDLLTVIEGAEDKEGLERFDSRFEAEIYLLLLDFVKNKPLIVVRQLKIPVTSRTPYIAPIRGMIWRCDFAVYDDWIFTGVPMTTDLLPRMLIEAKGQVSRDFKLTLALLPPWVNEILTIVCQDTSNQKALLRCLKKDAPIRYVQSMKKFEEWLSSNPLN